MIVERRHGFVTPLSFAQDTKSFGRHEDGACVGPPQFDAHLASTASHEHALGLELFVQVGSDLFHQPLLHLRALGEVFDDPENPAKTAGLVVGMYATSTKPKNGIT
ncbi:MAG: hypothetical protein R3E66_16715 [bacterium]